MKRNPNSACLMCGTGFYCPPSRKAMGRGKYCSYSCMGDAKRGKSDPNLTYVPPKGTPPWNKGHGRRDTTCPMCSREISVLDSQGQKHCSKECGDASKRMSDEEALASYTVLHARVKKLYGTPSECENCGCTDSKKFEWANISREYNTMDRSDWARLCCQCHRRYDFGTKNRIELSL